MVAVEDNVPYDRGWAWMVVLGMNMMHVFLIGYLKTFGILFVELQDWFKLSSQQTAWVSTAIFLTIDILSPLGTAMADQLGSRPVVIVGGVIVSISLALSSFLINIEFMVGVMGVLFGIGATLCYAPSMIMVGYYFKKRLGIANALAVVGSSIGQFLMPPLVTLLLDFYSFRETLLIMSAIMLHLSLAGALLRPISYYAHIQTDETIISLSPIDDEKIVEHDNRDVINEIKERETENFPTSCSKAEYGSSLKPNSHKISSIIFKSSECNDDFQNKQPVLIRQLRTRNFMQTLIYKLFDLNLLRNPVYIVFTLGCCLANFSYIGLLRYVPAHCRDLGIGSHQRAVLLSIAGMTDLVTRLLVGCILDTTFVKKTIKRYRLLSIALMFSALNSWLVIYGRTFWQIALSCTFYGVFGGVFVTLISITLIDLFGANNLSRAWGFMLLLSSITTLGEPLVLGYLRDVTGHYDAAFITCASLFFLGSLLVLVAPSLNKQSKANDIMIECDEKLIKYK